MDEQALREMISDVKAGRLSRRTFVQTMVGLGLTAPLAAQMLASAGVAQAQPKAPRLHADPARRRRAAQDPLVAGPDPAQPALRHRHQGPGRLAHLLRAARPASIPTATSCPILAAEVPSVESGHARPRRTWVTWKLKRGVTWHDGKPFTADDVVFNWEFVADPATAAVTSGSYREIERVEKLDSHTVKLVFNKPQPFWADAFCGARGMIIPKHLFEAYQGRQVPRGAGQPQAGRHRRLPLRGLQAGRRRPGRDQPRLPRAEPPVLRHARDEGRRRRGLGRAGRAPDRASTTTPGTCRWRTTSSSGSSRAARGGSTSGPPAAPSTSSSTTPTRGRRSTASGRASRPPIRSSPIPRCARP